MKKIIFCIFMLWLAIPGLIRADGPPAAAPPATDDMIGAMLMFGFRGASVAAISPQLKDMLRDGHIGHVILFDRDVTENSQRNIVSPEQLKNLTAELRQLAPRLMFIAVDQEGGQVRRLKPQKGFFDLPSAQVMGQGNVHATGELAESQGKELHELGINMNLAPVVDVDTNPFNPAIGRLGRSFATDARNVAQHALAFGLGLAKSGVAPVLKHFPGQGCAEADSHLSLPDITQCWNPDVDLLPYADIFRHGWPGAVMLGHVLQKNLDPALPSSISTTIVSGLLRRGLGWNGIVISDDLQMKSVQADRDMRQTIALAVNAGVDILLFGNNLEWDEHLPQKVWDAMQSLIADGTITEARLRQSWDRISALHSTYSRR